MEPSHLETLYPLDARSSEIEKILAFVKEGQSAQLIGLPGVGRNNLLGLLTYNRDIRTKYLGGKENKYHFVLANLSEVKNRSLFDVMKFLFLELVSTLHERRFEEEFSVTDKMLRDALSYNDELVLFQSLKDALDFLANEKDFVIVFFLERFDSYVPHVTSDFFTNLRSMRSRAKYKFSVVFSLPRPLEDLIEPTLFADFHEFIADNHIYVSLEDKTGMDFRLKYLEKLSGKKLTEKQKTTILDLTAGHGKLTKLCAEITLSHLGENQTLTAEFFLSHKSIQGALFEIWSFLTPSEQEYVTKLAINKALSLPEDSFLNQVGLVKGKEIAISLFAAFIKAQSSILNAPTPITYDPQTNAIKQGETVLSDLLTVSEFKLLRLLLENPDKVVERDEIINAVWKNTASTAGVTDQAVDQLVFRLRKKIEDDPNHPVHILTVKGRGVKFSQ